MKKNIIIGILAVALLAVGLWGYTVNSSNISYKNNIETEYQRDFTLLLSTLRDMTSKLDKCAVSSDPAYLAQTFSEVSKEAATAQEMLTRLPLSHVAASKTTEFLSRVEDFSFAMLTNILSGGKLSADNVTSLQAVTKSCNTFLDEMYAFSEQISKENTSYTWRSDEEGYYFEEASENMITKSFTSMDEQFVDYPAMIYDGPFSDHLKNKESKGLTGNEVKREEVEKKIRESLGKNASAELSYSGQVNGDIPCYAFVLKEGDCSLNLQYSVKGGHLINANCTAAPKTAKLSMDEAQKKAEEFMKRVGVDPMTPTYYEKYNNIGVFNFAYIQDGVTCYSDLIKVQVSLEDGSVVGYEATGYYMSHEKRTLASPAISKEDAQKKLSVDLKVTKASLALIPTAGKNEVLCYEFKGTKGEEMFIVYVDAQTGHERQIFKIIEANESVLVL